MRDLKYKDDKSRDLGLLVPFCVLKEHTFLVSQNPFVLLYQFFVVIEIYYWLTGLNTIDKI